ncbi:MAG: ATP-binding protein, partial [Bdellovibrionota bacterium]
GGDHARAKVRLEHNGENIELEKTWGQGASVALEQGGARITGEEKAEELLRSFLPAPAATFQSVLFMGQGALGGTVTMLQERREALHSLGDLLRLTLDQTSGVSVARLKERLAAQILESFDHWDRLSGLPEKGKGIDDPWKKGVGLVLAAYYRREELKRAAVSGRQLEGERDRVAAELAAVTTKREIARAFVAENKKFVESASQRQALESQAARARDGAAAMVKDFDAWAKAEALREMNAPEVERLGKERAALEAELKTALASGKKRDALARLEKVRAARARVEEAKQRAAAVPAVTPEALRRVRAAQAEVDGLRSGLKSGKIQLQFEVKEDLEVEMRKDLEAGRKGVMTPAKPLVLNAGGRIQLTSRLFNLTVTSGDGKIAELEEQLTQKTETLAKLLAGIGAENLEQAQERQEKYAEAAQECKTAEALLGGLLAPGEKVEDLEKLAAASEGGAGRDPALVQADLQNKLADLGGKRDTLVRAEGVLQDLSRRYGVNGSGQLMERAVEQKTELAAVEKKLGALPVLPPQVGDLAAFPVRFEAAQAEAASLGEKASALGVTLAELKARLPEQSAEDLERAYREAATAFNAELARGKALLRVEEAMNALDGAGADLFAGFQAEFEKQVANLSRGKYGKTEMTDALPAVFGRSDGASVPYDWLSSGTKDAFALALRLAMASHFLGAGSGFLMIDDPLVNMDPERQKIAAGMLREFAARRQILVFTCHPQHAELLGGNCINLN